MKSITDPLKPPTSEPLAALEASSRLPESLYTVPVKLTMSAWAVHAVTRETANIEKIALGAVLTTNASESLGLS